MERYHPTYSEDGEQPPKRKKANSDKDRRILRIVENYHLYQDDIIKWNVFQILSTCFWDFYILIK